MVVVSIDPKRILKWTESSTLGIWNGSSCSVSATSGFGAIDELYFLGSNGEGYNPGFYASRSQSKHSKDRTAQWHPQKVDCGVCRLRR